METKTKEIQKLLSYRNDKGWVVLCKGARLVFSGYGTTVLTIFQKFDEWKLLIQQGSVFEECILTEYNNDKGLAVSFKSRRVLDISHILKNVLTAPKSWRCISSSNAATNNILRRQHIRRKYLLHHSYTKLCRSQHVGLIAEHMPIYKIIIAALFLYLQYYFYSIIVCVSKFVTSVKV